MSDGFVVHLGSGTYLSASGDLVDDVPEGAQVYEIPKGLRLDLKKVEVAFSGLTGMVPADDATKQEWIDRGIPKDLIDALSKVAAIAGVIATAMASAGLTGLVAMLGVMFSMLDLMSSDAGMSPEMGRALNDIKNQVVGNELIDRAAAMIHLQSQFDGSIDTMKEKLTQLVVEQSVGAQRAAIFANMRAIVDGLAQPLSEVRNQDWSVTDNPDIYKGRAFAAPVLVLPRSDGSLASTTNRNVIVFDYRLGIPMLVYAATAFTGLVQVAMPWFRSAGLYAGHLRKTADAIDKFVIRMQDECLARTDYSATTVLQQQVWPIFDVAVPVGGPEPPFEGPLLASTYAVGAFDLVRYDDSFLSDRWVAEFVAGADTGPRGWFNYHWFTGATLLEDIAAAANEQAAQDYARLQVATGLWRLVYTSAWLRFLSTPPNRSQTISGSVADSRRFRDEAPTTATSPPIFPVGVITDDATLRRYDARNRVRITTQEPGYVPVFHYKIVLRMVNSVFNSVYTKEAWDKRSYVGGIWTTDYVPTDADPRNKRLETNLQPEFLAEIPIYEGPSPTEPVNRNSQATVQAATFDWYVPVLGRLSRFAATIRSEGIARNTSSGGPTSTHLGTGGVSIHLAGNAPIAPVPMSFRDLPSPLVASVVDDGDSVTPFTDVSLDQAERRHARVESVSLAWELNWTADQLEVRLTGSPQDRPFQVHVVVEETIYSGEALPDNLADILADPHLTERIHTPFVAEIVNQLVLVPEEFFVEERQALQQGAKLWHEFNQGYAKSAPISPGDPIEGLQNSVRDQVSRSLSTATLAGVLGSQVEFAQRQAPDLWNATVQGVESPTDG